MRRLALLLFATVLAGTGHGGDTPSPADARVYFVNLKDGQTVSSPFTIQFGLSNMGVAPAGVDTEQFKNVGHHHLFINSQITESVAVFGIPFDDNHRHFGGGQTEVTLDLQPGTYRLKLVLGDPNHQLHDPVVASPTIKITVE